jgi:hypothetical protein
MVLACVGFAHEEEIMIAVVLMVVAVVLVLLLFAGYIGAGLGNRQPWAARYRWRNSSGSVAILAAVRRV